MAVAVRYLDDDVVRLYPSGERKSDKNVTTLFWGDAVRVLDEDSDTPRAELSKRVWSEEGSRYETQTVFCDLPAKVRFRDRPVLKVRFVDVGQGDACIVETPSGQIVLIDGGEEEHLARYINVAYSHLIRKAPLHVDAIVVTHGDADHFSGLTKLLQWHRSRTTPLVTVDRVFHNGLVKGPSSRDLGAFGRVARQGGRTFAVDLAEDLTDVPQERMSASFRAWCAELGARRADGAGPTVRRLSFGDDDAFDFLGPDISVKVLGPITDVIDGAPALRFLSTPGGRSPSASHTINGHSVVLRLTYGNTRFLFGADLNEESEERLLERAREVDQSLASEVLKVPPGEGPRHTRQRLPQDHVRDRPRPHGREAGVGGNAQREGQPEGELRLHGGR